MSDWSEPETCDHAGIGVGCVTCLRERISELEAENARLSKVNVAMEMVCIEVRELLGEVDFTEAVPKENLEALRALVWRVGIKEGKVKHV